MELVTIENGDIITNSYIMAKQFGVDHGKMMKTIRATLSIHKDLEINPLTNKPISANLSLNSENKTVASSPYTSKDEIRIGKVTTDNNVSVKGYIVTEIGFLMILQEMSTPKNREAHIRVTGIRNSFIQAFMMLKDAYNHQKNTVLTDSEKEVLKAVLPVDPFGTVSEVNELPREDLVHGYYRSRNGKKVTKEFVEELEMIQYDLFGGQETIPYKTKGITYKS